MSYGAIGTIERDTDGKLPSYAWPGGYPILYIDAHNETLCANCATKDLDGLPAGDKDRPVTWFIHYEGSSIFCAECNKETESAYGDPDVEEGAEERTLPFDPINNPGNIGGFHRAGEIHG